MCVCVRASRTDEEVFHRIDLVHQAFDGEHTGYVSLSKVLLAMAQCFTTDVEEQVSAAGPCVPSRCRGSEWWQRMLV